MLQKVYKDEKKYLSNVNTYCALRRSPIQTASFNPLRARKKEKLEKMTSLKTQIVQSKGIYHGLPVFSPDIKGLTAVVTGASGISGTYMVGNSSE